MDFKWRLLTKIWTSILLQHPPLQKPLCIDTKRKLRLRREILPNFYFRQVSEQINWMNIQSTDFHFHFLGFTWPLRELRGMGLGDFACWAVVVLEKLLFFNVYWFLERWIHVFVSKHSEVFLVWFTAALFVPIQMGTKMAYSYKGLWIWVNSLSENLADENLHWPELALACT